MFTRNKQQTSAVKAKMWLMCCFTLFICIGTALPVNAATQTMTLSVTPAAPVITDDPIVIGLDYNTSDANVITTGIDMRIHFDSTKMTYTGYDNFLAEGQITLDPDSAGGATADTGNEDGDESTDKVVKAKWLSFSPSWPGNAYTLPLRVLDLNFTPIAAGTDIAVNVTFVSGDANYDRAQGNPDFAFDIVCPQPTATLTADAAEAVTICKGNGSLLAWNTSGATTVTIDQGIGDVADTGSLNVSPDATTTYTITAENACGPVTDTVTVTVNDAPVINGFTANPSAICSGGAGTTLEWTVSDDTTSVSIEPGSIVFTDGTTSTVVTPSSDTTYTLTATNACGSSDTFTADVTVNDGPQISFSAEESTICAGGSTKLEWTVTGETTSITLDGASVSANSEQIVSPLGTTEYTLTATSGFGNTTQKVTVTVNDLPVIVLFKVDSADAVEICEETPAELSWTVSGATSVTINQGVGSVDLETGTEAVSPNGDIAYTLSAENNCGTVTETVTVMVNPLPEISFTADKMNLEPGETSTLTWTVTGADTVTIDNGVDTGNAFEGTEAVAPDASTTYTLTATSVDGCEATDTVTISMNQLPDVPVLTAPLNGATDVLLMPELTTDVYNDADGDAHAMTQWQVATDQLFDEASLVYNEETDEYLTSVFVPPNLILEAGTMYYWHARFNDGTSWSDYSANWSFTTTADGAIFVDGVNADDVIGGDDDKLLGEDFVYEGAVVNTDTIKSFKSKVDPTVQIGLKSKTAGVVITKCGSADSESYAAFVDKVPAIPFGLIEVALTVPVVGGEAAITVHYSEAVSADFTWWKFDPNKGEFYDYQAAYPEIADLVVASEDRMSVTVKFKDGGYGDLVSTPDGKIIDPSGPSGATGGGDGGHHGDSCFIGTVQK